MRNRIGHVGPTLPIAFGAVAGSVVVWRSWDASSLSQHRWAAIGALLVMIAVTLALPRMTKRLKAPGHVPALIGVVQFAIYCCVPETGQIGETVVVVIMVIAIELAIGRSLPWWLHSTAAAIVLWSGMFGATGRESALIGALFASWPIVLVAVMPRRSYVIAALGSIAVIAVARTGALQPTASPALVAVAVAAPISVLLALLAVALRVRGPHPLDRAA